jgi:hypothetical protein
MIGLFYDLLILRNLAREGHQISATAHMRTVSDYFPLSNCLLEDLVSMSRCCMTYVEITLVLVK